jgi:aspartokinase/homoserine dehydrogenase 1
MSEKVVMKFGGTSVGSAARIRDAAKIVVEHARTRKVVVVTSAMAKATDMLLAAAMEASTNHRPQLEAGLKRLRDLHDAAAKGLKLDAKTETQLLDTIHAHLDDLEQLLDSVYALRELTPRALDLVVSYGERLSIHLVAAAITQAGAQAEPVEANKLIVTDDQFGGARPLLPQSERQAAPVISQILRQGVVPVVTGFMGANAAGITTTLGRGGSDYTATILGYCIGADEVWIWTDVDGVMTADPRIVAHAHTIPELTYNEAAELSYFGAKVLHPLTMLPASLKQIPIFIKNTFNPTAPGTRISERSANSSSTGKAISSMSKLSLITVQGKGMIGVPGVAAKVFGVIAAEHINVMFISQASSEFNISFVVARDDGPKAAKLLSRAFQPELSDKSIEMVKLAENLAIVAVVGEGMMGQPGIAGTIFTSLGDADVNIIAIAQGSSELNISLVVEGSDVPKAVRSVHDAFHLVKS